MLYMVSFADSLWNTHPYIKNQSSFRKHILSLSHILYSILHISYKIYLWSMNIRQNNQAEAHVHNRKRMSKSCFSLKNIYIYLCISVFAVVVQMMSMATVCYFKECGLCDLSGDCGRKCRGLLRLSGRWADIFCLVDLETVTLAARRVPAPAAGWEMFCMEAFTAASTFPSNFIKRLRISSNSTAIVLFKSASAEQEIRQGLVLCYF